MLKHFLWIVPAVLIVRTAMAAAPLAGCTDVDFDSANLLFNRAQSAYKEGNISLLELKASETSHLDVSLCAGKIDLSAYCSRKGAALEKMLDIFKTGNMITGQAGITTFSTLSQLAALRTSCQ